MPNLMRTGGGGGGKVEITVETELSKASSRMLPGLSQGGEGVCGIASGDFACFSGGCSYDFTPNYSDKVDAINVKTNTGKLLGTMTTPVNFAAGGAVNGLAVFGGGIGPNSISNSDQVASFNLTTGTKQTLKSLPLARGRMGSGSAGNMVIFAGGKKEGGGEKAVSDLTIVNPISNTTQNSNTFLPARYSVASSNIGDEVFLIGGYSGSESEYSSVTAVSGSTGTTRNLPSLSAARGEAACAAAGDEIIVTGGRTSSKGMTPSKNVTNTDCINVKTGTKRAFPTLPEAYRSTKGATSYGEGVFGGCPDRAGDATIVSFNFATSTRRTIGNLSARRTDAAALSVNNQAIFGGGYTSGQDNTVEAVVSLPANSFTILPVSLQSGLALASAISVDVDCTYKGANYTKGAVLAYDQSTTTATARNISAEKTSVSIRHVLKKGGYTI